MLTTQRKQLILERLARDGQIIAKELAQELSTSEDTVRRDLRELASSGKLRRVHGGALPVSAAEGDLRLREQVSVPDKVALGRAGAAMVQPGQLVFLDGGTTTLQLARHLPTDLRATVATHSPHVAVALSAHPHIEILMLGGRLFRHSMVAVGAAVVQAAEQLRPDLFFLGVTGVHPQAGLSTGDAEEAAVKRALYACATTTVVMASSEKLMTASPYVIAPLDALALLLVPAHTSESTVRALGDRVAVQRVSQLLGSAEN